MKRNGFTLVELAIVLVIIGLLVGGVLAGQELINQARISRIISEAESLRRSVATFQSKYTQLPGDFNKATNIWGTDAVAACLYQSNGNGTETCSGNGNGSIEYFQPYAPNNAEMYRSWQHLSNAQVIDGQYTGITGTSCPNSPYCQITGTNAPRSNAVQGGSWSMWTCTGSWCGALRGKPMLNLGNPDNITPTHNTGGYHYGFALSCDQVRSVDMKTDDSMPFAGRVELWPSTLSVSCYTGTISVPTTPYSAGGTEIVASVMIGL